MDDKTLLTDRQLESVCPWCSAALAADAPVCSSCGAILTSDEEQDLPGLTAVDEKIARGEKRPASRSRLLSWISGDYADDKPAVAGAETGAQAHALAPPDPDVQREILRLELEAEVSRLQAEADSIRSDAMIEGRIIDEPAPDAADAGTEESPAGEAPVAEMTATTTA
jgi:hypothetical protein